MENDAGVAYRQGQGSIQDYAMARQLFLAAAQQGSPRADINIAQLYQHGLGVPVSGPIAEAWYEKAGPTGIALLAEQIARAEQKAAGEAQLMTFFQTVRQYELAKKQACEQSAQCRQAMEKAEAAQAAQAANDEYWQQVHYDSCLRAAMEGIESSDCD
jgi:hypothetical protein